MIHKIASVGIPYDSFSSENALASGDLVRLLPRWYCELGTINLYFPNKKLLPLKTRVPYSRQTEVAIYDGLRRE